LASPCNLFHNIMQRRSHLWETSIKLVHLYSAKHDQIPDK
jgi:hypothetical protein